MDPSWTVLSADGSPIAGYELGGEGEVVLIAHATGLCAPAYRQLAELLSARFRVVGFDFRAHGRSIRAPGADLAWRRMGDDVVAVLDHLGEPVHGFGHSMGGAALMMAASRQPGSFSTLFLFEPVVFIVAPESGNQLKMAEAARRRRSRFASRAEALARYANNPPFDRVLAGCLADYVEHGFVTTDDGEVELACDPDDEGTIFEHGLVSTIEHVGTTEARTTIAIGRVDGPGPAVMGAPLVSALPNATLLGYEHVDHFGPLQDPWSIARDIAARAATPLGD